MILKEKINSLYKRYYRLKVNVFSSTKVHEAIAKVPILRALISYEGNKIHEIMSGFVYSQILHLLIYLDIFQFLKKEGRSLDEVSKFMEITLFNPVVYLVSGFRWSFFGNADVPILVSLLAISSFTIVCILIVAWIFKTGWRIKQ